MQVEDVLAQPPGGELLQVQAVPRRRLVGDQRVGRVDPELRLGGARRRPAAQPGQLLAQQVPPAGGNPGRLPGPFGPGQHVRRVAAVVRVDHPVVDLPDPGADRIQEPPVVADHQQRPVPGLSGAQVLGQPGHCFHVEVVGRLVQHQQVVVGQQQLGETDPTPLTAAERRSAERPGRPRPAGARTTTRVAVSAAQTWSGCTADDHVADGPPGAEVVGLLQVADRGRTAYGSPARSPVRSTPISSPAGWSCRPRCGPTTPTTSPRPRPRLTPSSSVRVPKAMLTARR